MILKQHIRRCWNVESIETDEKCCAGPGFLLLLVSLSLPSLLLLNVCPLLSGKRGVSAKKRQERKKEKKRKSRILNKAIECLLSILTRYLAHRFDILNVMFSSRKPSFVGCERRETQRERERKRWHRDTPFFLCLLLANRSKSSVRFCHHHHHRHRHLCENSTSSLQTVNSSFSLRENNGTTSANRNATKQSSWHENEKSFYWLWSVHVCS